MFTFNASNRFLARVLAGLLIGVTVIVGSLIHAATNAQAFL
jgi:hypothetical protein